MATHSEDETVAEVEERREEDTHRITPQSPGAFITIVVDDPEKHGEDHQLSAYASYRISTRSNWSIFASEEFFVRRRYTDFLWLRTQLVKTFPTVLIPPLPEKQRMDYLDRLSPEFLEKRRRFLEKFLIRISTHPKLRSHDDFHTFLEAKSWALETVKTGRDDDVFESIGELVKSLKAPKLKTLDEKFENLRHYVNDFNERMLNIDKGLQKMQKLKVELASVFGEIGASLLLLSDSEIALCDSLSGTGRIFEQNSKFLKSEAFYDDITFNDPVKEYILYVDSIKLVQKRRDQAQAHVEALESELYERKQERAELENELRGVPRDETMKRSSWSSFKSRMELAISEIQLSDPEAARKERIQRIDEKITQLDEDLEKARLECDNISADLVSEMRRFNADKIRDFKTVLEEYANSQIDHHRKTLAAWESLIPVLEKVDFASSS
eukprot:TRINITY_DN8743_c0_g6_i1.p1 TRINITY_DN8743_c0_g6~~TRINITY_DN8743_c0_g6_i1.p1  ORF type:complete len:440 (-),score=105.63 TRINITY_DN8743_c0_g6_i1:286-1605(-)